MKKLIVMLAIGACAVMANAATVSWSFSGVASDPTKGAFTTYTAYLIDSSVVSLSDMTTALSGGDRSLLSSALTNTTTKGTTSAGASAKPVDAYTTGATPTYYTIVLNSLDKDTATWYLATAEKTGTVSSSNTLSMGFGSQASATWVEIAPEPTSGLMMLLGMGVLALRRRRA